MGLALALASCLLTTSFDKYDTSAPSSPAGAGGCKTDDDCAGNPGGPLCTSTGACGQCRTDHDCKDRPGALVCSSNRTCTQCSATNKSACTGLTNLCDESGTCAAQCTKDDDCKNPALPVCANKICRQCSAANKAACARTADAGAAGFHARDDVCDETTGTCVPPCTAGACPATTPTCGSDGVCVKCSADSDCPTELSASCPACTHAPTCTPKGSCEAPCASAGTERCRDALSPQTCGASAWVGAPTCELGTECKPDTGRCGPCADLATANAWTKLTTTGAPSGRADGVLAFDPSDGSMIYFGGMTYFGSGAPTQVTETWRLAGNVWTALRPTSSPRGRLRTAAATNTKNGKVYLFGGGGPTDDVINNDLWEWDGRTWTELCPTTATAPCATVRPTPRANHALAYDAARDVLVLIGGNELEIVDGVRNVVPSNDTWEWDGGKWSLKCGRSLPPCGIDSHYLFGNATYDTLRRRVVYSHKPVFVSTPLASTYEYDGVGWTTIPTATSPPAAGWEGTVTGNVYDPVRRVMVTMTHRAEGQVAFWEWNGACWSDTTPAGAPYGVQHQAMAYDLKNARLVRFGGYTRDGGAELARFTNEVYVRPSLPRNP